MLGKKRKKKCSLDIPPKQAGANTAKFTHTSVPSDEEQRTFLGRLASLKSNRPVINSVIPEFCNAYVPMSLAPDLSPVLSSVHETSNLKLGYYELLEKAENTTIIVTPQQVNSVEQKT